LTTLALVGAVAALEEPKIVKIQKATVNNSKAIFFFMETSLS
jgi:hypothetical protein